MGKIENEKMVQYLLENGYADERTASAMRKVLREFFIPDIYKQHAYVDSPLPIGAGQTISAPSIVAIMTTKLEVKPGMKILEVGAGSGYQAAILCELVGESGKVYTIERVPELIEQARMNISKIGYKNIEIIYGDGTLGYKEASPYDRIIVTAGAPRVPPPLIEQLKMGGKMIIPVGALYWQDLVLLEKSESGIEEKNLLPVMFVPLIGEYGYKSEQM